MDASTPVKAPKSEGGWGWALRMAWRDSRGSRRLLALFSLCVVFGIAALVAVSSLRDNLERVVEVESRSLLGADLVLQGRRPFSPEVEQVFRQLGGEQAREWRFRSMAVFPDVENASRFVQVRGLEGDFPFYGDLETAPANLDWQRGDAALIEEHVLQQLGLQPGDRVRLGEAEFTIAGALVRVAGESEVAGFFSPRVYISREGLERTGLLQFGSVVSYLVYFQFPDGLDADRRALIAEVRPDLFIPEGVRVETVANRQEGVREVLDNLFSFLNLTGFVALLLGGVGIGGAVQVYIGQKLATVALLRCLGASALAAFRVYLLQTMLAGLAGALVGAAIGFAVQMYLPVLIRDFVPFTVDVQPSWSSLGFGLLAGWTVATLCALIPLLAVRRISPLRAIRAGVEEAASPRDPWRLAVMTLLGLLTLGFTIWQTGSLTYGLAFAGGLAVVLAVLAGLALLLRSGMRRLAGWQLPYIWRLAASNLYRPGNRTIFLMVTLGVGALLINTLYLVQGALLSRVDTNDTTEAANVVLIDVQPDQLEDLQARLAETGVTPLEVLPIVTMRLQSVRGKTLAELRADPNEDLSNWVYGWEFRVTYRDRVLDNATVIAGEFVGRYEGPEPIPISLAESILEDLRVTVGDEIVWDVQGLPVRTVVSSIRRIQWEAGRQNFAVVWPLGLIEEAPTMYAVAVRAADRAEVGRIQQAMTASFPNVSVLDLSLVFETAQNLLERVRFVIEFMATFTIFTGLVVLLGAVLTSRYQRVRESVLLRTLGASGSFVRRVMALEYAFLGLLGALAGALLSLVATALLGLFVFQTAIPPAPGALLVSSLVLGALTLLTGLVNSRGIASHPPLAVLRQEAN